MMSNKKKKGLNIKILSHSPFTGFCNLYLCCEDAGRVYFFGFGTPDESLLTKLLKSKQFERRQIVINMSRMTTKTSHCL